MTDKLTEFTIDRNKWIRGEDGATLLNQDGRMCCLGIAAKACNIPDEAIREVGEPGELTEEGSPQHAKTYFSKLPFLGELVPNDELVDDFCVHYNYIDEWGEPIVDAFDEHTSELEKLDYMSVNQSDACKKLMSINDDKNLTEEDREKQITSIFASHGVKVNFIG